MPDRLRPITAAEHRRRLLRIQRLARDVGFVGRVEYTHEKKGSGGAQFGLGNTPQHDLLRVDARAFERDADPEDFSLEAIIGHERGHQLLHRHAAFRGFLARWSGPYTEELMASVLGSLLMPSAEDREDLLLKAVQEAAACGVKLSDAVWLVNELRRKLGALL